MVDTIDDRYMPIDRLFLYHHHHLFTKATYALQGY